MIKVQQSLTHRRWFKLLLSILVLPALLGCWEISAQFFRRPDPKILPPPIQVIRSITENPAQLTAGQPSVENAWLYLVEVTARTVWRVLKGMFFGLLIALPIGFLVGQNALANLLLTRPLTFFAPLSPIAWIPIAFIVIPDDDARSVFMVFTAVVFLMALATANAVMSIDKSLADLARSLGANKWQLFRRVIFFGSLPAIFVSLRVNFFAAWIVVLLAESVSMPSNKWGLGNLVWNARQTTNRELALFYIGLLAIVGFTLDRCLLFIQNKLFSWKKGTTLGD